MKLVRTIAGTPNVERTMSQSETPAVAANRDLGRRFFEAQDRLRGGPAPELCAADYRATLGGNPPMDRAQHEGFALWFYAGFPDAQHDIDEVIATHDRAVVRFTIRGTHTGSFFGIPASNRHVRVVCNVVLHIADGRVSRLHGVFDEAGLLRQIGVLPTG